MLERTSTGSIPGISGLTHLLKQECQSEAALYLFLWRPVSIVISCDKVWETLLTTASVWSTKALMPKSAILTCPLELRRMFAGLMSRCTYRYRCTSLSSRRHAKHCKQKQSLRFVMECNGSPDLNAGKSIANAVMAVPKLCNTNIMGKSHRMARSMEVD